MDIMHNLQTTYKQTYYAKNTHLSNILKRKANKVESNELILFRFNSIKLSNLILFRFNSIKLSNLFIIG